MKNRIPQPLSIITPRNFDPIKNDCPHNYRRIMKMMHENGGGRYSAHNSIKPMSFYCEAPDAKSVFITGDFNHWTPVAMARRPDGCWYAQISLCHGHHQYRFLVDGKPMLDPSASGVGHDKHGDKVSLVAVS